MGEKLILGEKNQKKINENSQIKKRLNFYTVIPMSHVVAFSK